MNTLLTPRQKTPTFFAICAALLALGPARAWAGFANNDVGTSGAQFLKLGAGARGESMGEAYIAVVDQADAIYWNPAALSRIEKHSATFMHESLPAGINYDFLGYGQKLASWGALGGSLQYLSQPGIEQTDASGLATGGTFRPHDFAASVGGAYTIQSEEAGIFNGSSLGVAAKYIESAVTKSVAAGAADLGFLSAPFRVLDRDMRIAYVAQNLGGNMKFQQFSDSLPASSRLGASWALSKAWLLAAGFNEPLDNAPYFSVGTEYVLALDEESFAGRLGWDSRAMGDAGNWSGATFGFGAKLRRVGLDYALAPLGSLGMTHYISVSFWF